MSSEQFPPSVISQDTSYLFFFLLLANLFQYMEAGAVPALLVTIADSFDMNSGQQGLLGGVVYLSLGFGGPIAGYLLKHFSHKLVIIGAVVSNMICTICWAMTPVGYRYSTPLFIALRFLMGLCQCIICVYLPLWTNENAPRDKRTTWMSYLQASVPLGVMLGYIVASVFMNSAVSSEHISVAEVADSYCAGLLCWRWPFLIEIFLLAPLYAGLYFVPEESMDLATSKRPISLEDRAEPKTITSTSVTVQAEKGSANPLFSATINSTENKNIKQDDIELIENGFSLASSTARDGTAQNAPATVHITPVKCEANEQRDSKQGETTRLLLGTKSVDRGNHLKRQVTALLAEDLQEKQRRLSLRRHSMNASLFDPLSLRDAIRRSHDDLTLLAGHSDRGRREEFLRSLPEFSWENVLPPSRSSRHRQYSQNCNQYTRVEEEEEVDDEDNEEDDDPDPEVRRTRRLSKSGRQSSTRMNSGNGGVTAFTYGSLQDMSMISRQHKVASPTVAYHSKGGSEELVYESLRDIQRRRRLSQNSHSSLQQQLQQRRRSSLASQYSRDDYDNDDDAYEDENNRQIIKEVNTISISRNDEGRMLYQDIMVIKAPLQMTSSPSLSSFSSVITPNAGYASESDSNSSDCEDDEDWFSPMKPRPNFFSMKSNKVLEHSYRTDNDDAEGLLVNNHNNSDHPSATTDVVLTSDYVEPPVPTTTAISTLSPRKRKAWHKAVWKLFTIGIYRNILGAMTCLYFTVTGVQFWGTKYFTVVLHAPLPIVNTLFVLCAATGPTLGVFFGGWLIDSYIGGYHGRKKRMQALRMCVVLGLLGALAAMLCTCSVWNTEASITTSESISSNSSSSGVFDNVDWEETSSHSSNQSTVSSTGYGGVYVVTAWLWLALFCGGATLPACSGILVSMVPRSYRPLSSSLSMMVFNMCGYFASLVVSGYLMQWLEQQNQHSDGVQHWYSVIHCGDSECAMTWGFRVILGWSVFSWLFLVAAYREAAQKQVNRHLAKQTRIEQP